MNYIKFAVVLTAGLFIVETIKAQFTLSGEFRPRTEFNHGYKSLATTNQDWSTITTQRTRLNFNYSNQHLKTRLVLQDVRNWGNQPQLIANEDFATSIHEAWAEILFTPVLSLRAGRQELAYDDQRILGNVGWAQQGRSHDIALLKYENKFKFHFGIAHHENNNITNNFYDGPDAYKDLQFIWFNKSWKKSSFSFLVLNNGVPVMENTKQRTKFSQTLGGRFTKGLGQWSLATNFYWQTGDHASGKQIKAYNFLSELWLKNTFVAGYEVLSGNSYHKNDKLYAFTPLYGTGHKFNGYMDYFYVGNHINSVGLNDFYLKYNWSKNKFQFNADLHWFSAAEDITPEAKKYLGTELDLTFTYKIQETAAMSAGWSTMFAGKSMELLKGGDKNAGNHWACIMLTVTPGFIK